MKTRTSPLVVVLGGAALSLALLGCGSGGGYSKPPTQPGMPGYPHGASASNVLPQDTTKVASTSVSRKVQADNIAVSSAHDTR